MEALLLEVSGEELTATKVHGVRRQPSSERRASDIPEKQPKDDAILKDVLSKLDTVIVFTSTGTYHKNLHSSPRGSPLLPVQENWSSEMQQFR